MMRYAAIGGGKLTPVESYLPDNYWVLGRVARRADDDYLQWIIIAGEDGPGRTFDDYVIPRLASGFIFAREVDASDRRVVALLQNDNADPSRQED